MRRARMFTATCALAAAMMLGAGPALAHVCMNAAKPDGAGSGAIATFEITTQETVLVEGELNPQGHVQGGFVTFVILYEGAEVARVDSFAHVALPDPALNAGPGDDLCDGDGVDEVATCLAELLEGSLPAG